MGGVKGVVVRLLKGEAWCLVLSVKREIVRRIRFHWGAAASFRLRMGTLGMAYPYSHVLML